MKRTRAATILSCVVLAAAAGLAVSPGDDSDTGTTYGYLKLFNEVLALVRSSYVETVPQDDLYRGAFDGLLSALDGESEYLTAEDYRRIRDQKARSEGDPGIFLTRREGVLFVAAVMPGSDAQAKGLRLGDQVRRVGDQGGRDLSLTEAERALRGPAGTSILVAVSRREEPRREDVEVTRRKLSPPMPKLDPARDSVGIVRVPSFGPGAAKALSGVLDRLQKEKVRKAVIDLRGNAWGEIDEAVRAASLLAGDGVMARVKGRGSEEKVLKGSGGKSAWSGEMLLLTDAGTAHASELFVAALLDAGIAKQGGETTLGHGGEQEILPLDNGDYVSLTVRKYVSPSGKTWHGSGLAPSVPLPADGSVPFKDRAEQQLRKAVEWLRDQKEAAKAA